jgi:hypothetical protein
MSDTTSTKPLTAPPPEADSRALEVQATLLINQTKDALARARTDSHEASTRLASLTKVGEAMDALANQLATATFRAAGHATDGTSARAAIVSFVEELGTLAKQAAVASHELRTVMLQPGLNAAVNDAALRLNEAAQDDLCRVVHQLAEKASRQQTTRTIHVENRFVRTLTSASAEAMDDEQDESSDWSLGRSRSSGYKN